MFNDFVYAFVKVGCGFRFSLRKKSKSSTHPTTRDFLMCVCHRRADVMELQIFRHGQHIFMHSLLKLRLDKFVVFFSKRDIYQKKFFWRYFYVPEQG